MSKALDTIAALKETIRLNLERADRYLQAHSNPSLATCPSPPPVTPGEDGLAASSVPPLERDQEPSSVKPGEGGLAASPVPSSSPQEPSPVKPGQDGPAASPTPSPPERGQSPPPVKPGEGGLAASPVPLSSPQEPSPVKPGQDRPAAFPTPSPPERDQSPPPVKPGEGGLAASPVPSSSPQEPSSVKPGQDRPCASPRPSPYNQSPPPVKPGEGGLTTSPVSSSSPQKPSPVKPGQDRPCASPTPSPPERNQSPPPVKPGEGGLTASPVPSQCDQSPPSVKSGEGGLTASPMPTSAYFPCADLDPTASRSSLLDQETPAVCCSKWCHRCKGEGFLACFTCMGSTAVEWKQNRCHCYCVECSDIVHGDQEHQILPTALHIVVGQKAAICPKVVAFRVPAIKELAREAGSDVVRLTPSDIFREEPFVLQHVLGYVGMPDPSKWIPPGDNCKVVVGIIKIASAWNIRGLLDNLSGILEMPIKKLIHSKNLFKAVRSKLRISAYLSKVDTSCCTLCGGSWRLPPHRLCSSVLPCCLRPVHHRCMMEVQLRHVDCPGCGFPLTVEGYFTLLRRAETDGEVEDDGVGMSRPRVIGPIPPQVHHGLIDWSAIPPLPEEIRNYRMWERMTGRYIGGRPG